MSAELAGSIGRISALVDRVLECADWPSDPRSGDAWWRLAASTLPAQVLVLQCAAGTAPTITATPSAVSGGVGSSTECLCLIQDELTTWDWEGLDRDTLRAGAQLVLDVAELLGMP